MLENRVELTVNISLREDSEDNSNADDARIIAFIARKRHWNFSRRQVSVLNKERKYQYYQYLPQGFNKKVTFRNGEVILEQYAPGREGCHAAGRSIRGIEGWSSCRSMRTPWCAGGWITRGGEGEVCQRWNGEEGSS